ncbi:MAG: DUF1062 domain-containing protein [Defluviitaleaceae bacterium]|nr:DUF1062 domain-containing protein [Defluviitaleaceae bacterium]
MKENNEATWRIIPAATPAIIKQCSKCNCKSKYYCSEKFRVNANQSRVDIWLIYKCHKCDSTWKLAIKKGIKPRDLPPGLFDRFVNNDSSLAWQYAFDKHFLKQHSCVIDYSIDYTVEGHVPHNGPQLIHIQIPYIFDLKLGALLAKVLRTTVGQVRKHVEKGDISINPQVDIMKHRIKSDISGLLIARNICYNIET